MDFPHIWSVRVIANMNTGYDHALRDSLFSFGKIVQKWTDTSALENR